MADVAQLHPAPPNAFPDGMTIEQARKVLHDLLDDGHDCPVCRQHARVYRRKIHAAMARDLIGIYRLGGGGSRYWVDLTEVTGKRGTGDVPKARYWGLLEPQLHDRGDGSTRTGLWRLTERGVMYVEGRLAVQTYARVYNGKCLGLEGRPSGIRAALGTRFDYADLMAGALNGRARSPARPAPSTAARVALTSRHSGRSTITATGITP